MNRDVRRALTDLVWCRLSLAALAVGMFYAAARLGAPVLAAVSAVLCAAHLFGLRRAVRLLREG